MSNGTPTSFSRAQKWSLSLSLLVASAAVFALVVMTNYLAARHYERFNLSNSAQMKLSPLTRRLVASVTNQIKIIIYFDRDEPLYDLTWGLLKEYHFLNPRLLVETVDYTREPGKASAIKAFYKLGDKDLVIFDCNGARKTVYQSELSTLDLDPLISGKSHEVRRTHFKGEQLFTSAIVNVINPRQAKAYFLQGHDEHRPDSDDPLTGYSRFAGVLKENNVQFDVLRWPPADDVPSDCSLLIIAGPSRPFLPDELEKIDKYLRQGGRLFACFNSLGLPRPTGLEQVMANWNVDVGLNVVKEQRKFTSTGDDMVVTGFGTHPLIKPFVQSALYMLRPRTVAKAPVGAGNADAPHVEVLAATSSGARVVTDIRAGSSGPLPYPSPNDYVGVVPLMVAVEKGSIPNVSTDRGATRMVVVGDSIFLGNETIDKTSNHEFASHAINWLLARNELLGALGPRPIKEYKLVMSKAQAAAANSILLLIMPGAVLFVGLLVWWRRRR